MKLNKIENIYYLYYKKRLPQFVNYLSIKNWSNLFRKDSYFVFSH